MRAERRREPRRDVNRREIILVEVVGRLKIDRKRDKPLEPPTLPLRLDPHLLLKFRFFIHQILLIGPIVVFRNIVVC